MKWEGKRSRGKDGSEENKAPENENQDVKEEIQTMEGRDC